MSLCREGRRMLVMASGILRRGQGLQDPDGLDAVLPVGGPDRVRILPGDHGAADEERRPEPVFPGQVDHLSWAPRAAPVIPVQLPTASDPPGRKRKQALSQ